MRFRAAVTALLLAGCGGAHATQPAVRSKPALSPAPDVAPEQPTVPPFTVSLAPERLLIFFKRVVGPDPLASQLTVDRNGDASALVTNGGPGGEHRQYFRLTPAQLGRLRTLVRTAGLRDTGCCNPNFYIYFVSARGRSWRLEQKQVPRRAGALIGDLDAITDAHTSYSGPSG